MPTARGLHHFEIWLNKSINLFFLSTQTGTFTVILWLLCSHGNDMEKSCPPNWEWHQQILSDSLSGWVPILGTAKVSLRSLQLFEREPEHEIQTPHWESGTFDYIFTSREGFTTILQTFYTQFTFFFSTFTSIVVMIYCKKIENKVFQTQFSPTTVQRVPKKSLPAFPLTMKSWKFIYFLFFLLDGNTNLEKTCFY